MLGIIARSIGPLPNSIVLEGHTDSYGFSNGGKYTNWELSSARASRVVRVLMNAGLGPERRTRFISSNVEAITGHKPAAFLRHPGYRYGHIHPDDLPGYEPGLEALHNDGTFSQEYRFWTSAGDYL